MGALNVMLYVAGVYLVLFIASLISFRIAAWDGMCKALTSGRSADRLVSYSSNSGCSAAHGIFFETGSGAHGRDRHDG